MLLCLPICKNTTFEINKIKLDSAFQQHSIIYSNLLMIFRLHAYLALPFYYAASTKHCNCFYPLFQIITQQGGRRGSAPLLQLDSCAPLSVPVRGVQDASPDRTCGRLTRRRASAPTHHLLHG